MSLRVFFLLVFFASPARAEPTAEVWRFRSFTSEDGLAHDIVRDVVQDAKGRFYFATMAGITRYDAKRCAWRTLRPPGMSERLRVMDLAVGRDDAIWVATLGGGVGRYAAGAWRWYGREEGLPSDEITALFVGEDGTPWAIPTGGGIARFARGRWRVFGAAEGLAPGEMGRCTETSAGALLCATYGAKILQRFAHGRWSTVPVEIGGRRGFYVHDLLEDGAGRLWLATKGAGVIVGTRGDEGQLEWRVHDASSGLSGNRAGAIEEAQDGSIWVATSAGLSRYADGRWRSFTRRDGLPSNHVFAIHQAKDGALWFATLGGGVARYGPTRWQRFGVAQGFPSENLTGGLLVQPTGAVFVGTDAGIVSLGGPKPRVIATGDAALDAIAHMARGPRATWVATRDGVRRHDAHGWTHFPAGNVTGPAHPRVRWIAPGRDAIYFATDGGVSRLAHGTWRSFGVDDGLPDPRVNAILVARDGEVWAATAGGLARLEGERWVTAELTPSAAKRSDSPSRMKRVYRLVQDDEGTLWASGLDDAYKRPPGGAWRAVEPTRWLPAGVYSRFVIKTSDGALWFAVRGLGVRRVLDGRFSVFTSEAGLAGDTVRDVARLADGSILIATLGNGLSRYRPDARPPATFIGPRPAAGAPRTYVDGQAGVVISFAGQDVLKDTPTAALQYSHRVDGGPWSAFSERTRARLNGLRPGDHRFEVRAMDRDLNVDPTPAVHDFRIVRPWWREPWVLAVVIFALFALLYATFRVVGAMRRERAALAREHALVEEQRRFVRLASHELRKPLTRMAHRAEMLAMPEIQAKGDTVARYASGLQQESQGLARLVQTLLDQARVQEGIDLSRERVDLVALARGVVKELEPAAAQLRLEVPDGPAYVYADPLYVQLALRNLLDNAQKYGAPPIVLRVEGAGGSPYAIVSDAGEGIPDDQHEAVFDPFVRGRTSPDHAGFGLGLPFAREIARAHGGDLSLEPPPEGRGARFVLTFGNAKKERS